MIFFRVKTALLGQFSPTGAHREDCGPLCEQCCRSPWIASLEKRVSASSAHKPYKQRTWCRPASFEATGYHVQHKVCLHVEVARHNWMVVSAGYFLSSRRRRQNSTATPVVKHREHARGHCVGMGICHAWQCSGTIYVGSQCSCWDLATRRHGLWACEGGNVVLAAACMSWWRAHWWSRKPQRWACRVVRVLSVGGLISLGIWTHLSLYYCVVFVRVWSLLKVGLCTDSSPRKRCMLGRHLLIAHTV